MSYLDKIASLTPQARQILCEHATEHPHSGIYNTVKQQGSYLCRRCGLALFRADSQFNAGCGWPSFDVQIPRAVRQLQDADGQRIEIRCQRCDSHLGHVFSGEGYTVHNKRYCINSLALDFVADSIVSDSEEAIVAGGCFWGIDYYLQKIAGVLKVEVGYSGGMLNYPSYEQVCTGQTGHYEAVRVLYDPSQTNYHAILQRFFEIHDPTQINGQGNDLGPQYQSAAFYYNVQQQQHLNALINELQQSGYHVATKLLPVQIFWPAEAYHQHYYRQHAKIPTCHQPIMRFSR